MKRWIRLVQGLRIRRRLQDQYASEVAEGSGQLEKRSPDREEKAEGEGATAPVRNYFTIMQQLMICIVP